MQLPRVQFSILQLMAATLVAALAFAPIPYAMRTTELKFIVATAAYEVIFLPVLTSLLALALMKPGPARNRVIVVLCLTPVILVGLGYFGVWVAMFIQARRFIVRDIRNNPGITLFYLLLFGLPAMRLLNLAWRLRCPACGCRGLQSQTRLAPDNRMWVQSGVYKCRQCGRFSRATGGFGTYPTLRLEED